jgi:tRNA A-37 threonylcarbamoyl transferase component Bud32
MAEDLIGRTLGRYQITALVGRGAIATVYRATYPGSNQTAAVKVLHAPMANDPDLLGRFQQEARAVAALRHPNIVRVIDYDCIDSVYFMVMEYIDGLALSVHLSDMAAQGRRMPAAEVLRIFEPLCSAVDYAQGQGMIHCDIRPSNVLLTAQGEPVLTDYGIAKIIGITQQAATGTVMGSAYYRSPEQAQGIAVDGRTDIYSLGVMLFESLAGQVPYEGDTPATVLVRHITAPVPAVCALNVDLPPLLDGVMRVALAKDPGARFQTGQALAVALRTALGPLTGQGGAELGTATRVERSSGGAPAPQGATRSEARGPAPAEPPGERAAAHDVFISYAANDKPVADAVCAALEAKHIRCWIAPRDVLPGQRFAEALVTAIHAARVFVLVFSSATNRSQQVERELDRAVSARLSILPLRVEDVLPRESIEYYLAGQHWLDALTPPLEDHLERLAEAITTLLQLLPVRVTAPPETAPEPAVSATGLQAATIYEPASEIEAPEPEAEPEPEPEVAALEAEPEAGLGPETEPQVEPRPELAPTPEPTVVAAAELPVATSRGPMPATAPVPESLPESASAGPLSAFAPEREVGALMGVRSPDEGSLEAPGPSLQALHKPTLIAAAAVGVAWIVILLIIDLLIR